MITLYVNRRILSIGIIHKNTLFNVLNICAIRLLTYFICCGIIKSSKERTARAEKVKDMEKLVNWLISRGSSKDNAIAEAKKIISANKGSEDEIANNYISFFEYFNL